MKTFVRLFILVLSFLCGILVFTFGFSYFALIEPRPDTWIKFISEIVPEKRWILALSMGFCGYVTVMFPIYTFYSKKK